MAINSNIDLPIKPNLKIDVSQTFNIDSKITVKGYKEKTEWVPEIDPNYVFDKETTLSILACFASSIVSAHVTVVSISNSISSFWAISAMMSAV